LTKPLTWQKHCYLRKLIMGWWLPFSFLSPLSITVIPLSLFWSSFKGAFARASQKIGYDSLQP
jgi:hypothetical protein